MATYWPPKAPIESLRYSYGWGPRLSDTAEAITSIQSIVLTGDIEVAEDTISADGKTSVHMLVAGTIDTTCTIRLIAMTNEGEEMTQVMTIKIKDKT